MTILLNRNYLKRSCALLIAITIAIMGCKKVKVKKLDELPITDFNPLNDTHKVLLIDYLDSIEGNDQLLIGQNIGHADGSLNYGLYSNLSVKPSILGLDLGYDDLSIEDENLLNTIKNHWNAGGLVTVSTHMPNPFNRKSVDNKNKVELNKLYAANTSTNSRFKQLLINIGNFIQQLKDCGIIVMLRPFHEMNGGWFWWGNDKDWPVKNEFVAMWKYVHQYLEVERQLDNILWVYAPNFQETTEQKTVLHYYPGDEFVDIVALDYYWDDLTRINENQSLDLIRSINKPVGIAEIGSKTIRDGNFDNLTYLQLKDLGGISYFVAWHDYPGNKLSLLNNNNSENLLIDSAIINLDIIDFK